ncbi:MAG: hypothetical protein H0X29_03530 [Parachlamydiaceae bacterium]|nr:hypothetical protein [Parachlamydiaceae bacterium]
MLSRVAKRIAHADVKNLPQHPSTQRHNRFNTLTQSSNKFSKISNISNIGNDTFKRGIFLEAGASVGAACHAVCSESEEAALFWSLASGAFVAASLYQLDEHFKKDQIKDQPAGQTTNNGKKSP